MSFTQLLDLQPSHPLFAQHFLDLLFTREYRAKRCWPNPASRSPKVKMPRQIHPFTLTFLAKHVKDKMSENLFWRR